MSSIRSCIVASRGLMIGLFLLSPLIAAAEPETWLQWRGLNRDCTTVGAAFPDKLEALKQSWRVELGPSYSGPVVLSDRVIVNETVDEKTEKVRALDRKTGKEVPTGGVFLSREAKQRGLIDVVGHPPDAVEVARDLSNCPAAATVMLHRNNDPARTAYATTPNTPLQVGLLGVSVPAGDRNKLPTFLYLWQPDPSMERMSGK